MKKILIALICIIALSSIVSAYPNYLNISLSETVYQNTTFAEEFDLVEYRSYCLIVGIVNVTNPSTNTISDIYLNFTQTDPMKSNFTYVAGRTGTQLDNGTPGENWTIHIPELRGGQSTKWTYNLSCEQTTPPLNLSTSYSTPNGLQKKVLAGKNFTITQYVENEAPYQLYDVNITIYTRNVTWNQSQFSFNFTHLNNSGDYTNVTELTTAHWYWQPSSGTLAIGEIQNITYMVQAPYNVPTSDTYMAIMEISDYKTDYLVSNLTLASVTAVGDADIRLEKAIVRPSTDVNDTNVTWQSNANITIPFDISYNITKVTLWVTHNLSPLATNTPFGYLNKTYSPNALYNMTNSWSTSGQPWEFNYTDGSDPIDSPPPIVWVRPYYHLFAGKNQILTTNITQAGTDIYMKYIYVVNGYWLEVEKNITSSANNQYDINITVRNIGNAWTPAGLTVTVYDFVPAEFEPWAFSIPWNANSTVAGAGFNGTSFQWDIGRKSPYNASLGPPSSGSANSTWTTTYSVNGTGAAYKVSELYIVGLDPRKVEGAGAHEGITVIAGLTSSTKEIIYVVSVLALLALNVINFMMTRNINRKLE